MALIVFAFFSVAFLVIIQGAMADLDRSKNRYSDAIALSDTSFNVLVCTSNITSYCLKFNTTRATYNGALYACYKLAYGANLVQPTFDSEFQAVRQVSSISGTQKCSKDGKSFYGTKDLFFRFPSDCIFSVEQERLLGYME